MSYKQMKILLVSFALIGLSACGQSSPESVVDLNDRLVPIDSGSQVLDSEEETRAPDSTVDEDLVTEFPANVPLMGLKEKILANSNVPQKALENAFAYFNKNQATIRNKRYMSIFDIGQHSGQRRLYLIDLNTGDVKSMHVAHGRGSDKNHDGIATEFSNVSGSNMSSLGFMLTAETYVGRHGES
ncbi:murein L,D-transpeptidase catalytic domain family protein, partial [bacterium]|nr:murein L,D-transpeptidase catalytic domain family protein [bacterium]